MAGIADDEHWFEPMNRDGLTKEEQKKKDQGHLEKLKQAQELIAEVQIDMLNSDDKLPEGERTEDWRGLYGVRCDLTREIDRFRNKRLPHPWQ